MFKDLVHSDVAQNVTSQTWKDSAGRDDGPDGYQLFDASRAAFKQAQNWAQKPKTKSGYQFGDLFLKSIILRVAAVSEGRSTDIATAEIQEVQTEPTHHQSTTGEFEERVDTELTYHESLAAELEEKLRTAE